MEHYKKRLLFVNGHLNVGGVEKSLVDLLRHLDYSLYEVDLLLLQDLGDYSKDLPNEVNVIYHNTNKAYGPLLPTLYKNLLTGRWFELLLRMVLLATSVCGEKSLRLAAPLLSISRPYDCAIAYRTGICERIVAYAVNSKKKLLWWHHGECNYTQEQICQANKTWSHFDHVVTVSEGCKKMLQNNFSYPAEQYVVIPNLIDVERINQMAGDVSPYPELPDTLLLVTVGRLSPEKHIDNVPLAARVLIDKGVKDFLWYVVGDGDERKKIERLIVEQGVANRVVMVGSISNPYPYIKYADVLVHTSYVESQSITVLEAMALKTLCVVCKSIGPMEFMEHGKNGVLVEKGAGELLEGILTTIETNNNETMIEEASIMVCNRFSVKTIVSRFHCFAC